MSEFPLSNGRLRPDGVAPSVDTPWIVSVDDHVVEPPDVWYDRLSRRDREVGPRVVQDSWQGSSDPETLEFRFSRGGGGPVVDWWVYEDMAKPIGGGFACAGLPFEARSGDPIGYGTMRPGCYEQSARLTDMDLNRTERSLCFPTIPRFAGQWFLEARDKELALRCVKAYNDWMIDAWCAGSGGRLIPLCIIPLWDPVAAADEVRRNAARGCGAVSFTEMPSNLGLPSIHEPSRYWHPFFDACDETRTALCMHIGSGSQMTRVSPYAPRAANTAMTFGMAQLSLVEWLASGLLARYPNLKLVYSEGQVGWMPYVVERLDKLFEHPPAVTGFDPNMTEPPSHYIAGRIYGCLYDDETGIENRHRVGVSQICFEVDYPHQDSTWPNTHVVVARMAELVDRAELERILRTNALEMLNLA